MLKHNSELNTLWKRAKKRSGRYHNDVMLDMRYKSSQEFMLAFNACLLAGTSEDELFRMRGLFDFALEPQKPPKKLIKKEDG